MVRVSACVLFLFSAAVLADGEHPLEAFQSSRYWPMTVGNVAFYKAFEKDSPSRQLKVRAETRVGEIFEGKNYYYIYAPGVDIRYMVRRDETGVFMRMVKRKFALFGLSVDVHLSPELLFLKFPLAIGTKWSQLVDAKAHFLLFPINRKIEGRFHVVGREILHTEAGDIDCFVVKASLGIVNEPLVEKTLWYGENVGYVKADAPEDFSLLVGFRTFDEQTGTWIDRSPKGEALYK